MFSDLVARRILTKRRVYHEIHCPNKRKRTENIIQEFIEDINGGEIDVFDFIGIQISKQIATKIVEIAEEHSQIKSLCGIQENDELHDFRDLSLRVPDMILLAFDLRRNTSLKSLNLYNNVIHPEGAKYIADALKINNTLLSIDLANTSIFEEGIQTICNGLKENTGLIAIDLSSNNGGLACTEAIADLLETNKTLKHISFAPCNNFNLTEMKVLTDSLKRNTNIETLDISCYGLTNGFWDEEESEENDDDDDDDSEEEKDPNEQDLDNIKVITDILETNKTINTITLLGTEMDDKIAQYFFKYMQNNDKIKELYLGENNFRNMKTCKMIRKFLAMNTTIEVIDLENVYGLFANGGMKYIADGVKNNKSLKKLNIQGCFGDGLDEIIHLSHALKTNTTLEEIYIGNLPLNIPLLRGSSEKIDLSENMITDPGAVIIAEFMSTNKITTTLDLSYNHITEEGIKYISKALQSNSTLKHLNLSNNHCSHNSYNLHVN